MNAGISVRPVQKAAMNRKSRKIHALKAGEGL